MAVLSDVDRRRAAIGYCRFLSHKHEEVSFNRNDVISSMANIDSYFDSNGTAINNALPVAFRTGTTLPQKALFIAVAALMRCDPQLVVKLLGEID